MYNTIETTSIEPEKTLYLLDSSDDDIMLNAFKSMMKMDFQEYQIDRIKKIADATEKERKIIIICKTSTCRLENDLNLSLQNCDERKWDICLLIVVHNSSLGEKPRVPSRNKVDHLQLYKTFKNVIDVDFSMSRRSKMRILFGGEILQQFLGRKNDDVCDSVVTYIKKNKKFVCGVAVFVLVVVVVFVVVFVTSFN